MGRPCQCCEEASSSSSSSSSISVSSSIPSSVSSSLPSSVSSSSTLCRCVVKFAPGPDNGQEQYLTCPTPENPGENCYKIFGTYGQGSGAWNVEAFSCATGSISEGTYPNAGFCMGVNVGIYRGTTGAWPDGRNYAQLSIPDLWTNNDGNGNHLLTEENCPHTKGLAKRKHGNMLPVAEGDFDGDGVDEPGDPIPDGCSIPDTKAGRNSRSPNANCTSMTIQCITGPEEGACGSRECPCEGEVDDNGNSVREKIGLPENCPPCELICLDASLPPKTDEGECRINGGNCCLRTAGPQDLDCDGIWPEINDDLGPPGVCVTWTGTSNPPIYQHPDEECDNCGEWIFGVSCEDADTTGISWSFYSEIIPDIPECTRKVEDPGGEIPPQAIWPIFADEAGDVRSIYDMITNETANEVLILDRAEHLTCEDGACLWECMDDGERTYYGILLDDTDCTSRAAATGKPCGCPPSGPDGPCEPGDIIATQCGD